MIGKFLFKVIDMSEKADFTVQVIGSQGLNWESIIVGVLTILGSFLIASYAANKALKNAYTKAWWDKKVDAYMLCLSCLYEIGKMADEIRLNLKNNPYLLDDPLIEDLNNQISTFLNSSARSAFLFSSEFHNNFHASSDVFQAFIRRSSSGFQPENSFEKSYVSQIELLKSLIDETAILYDNLSLSIERDLLQDTVSIWKLFKWR